MKNKVIIINNLLVLTIFLIYTKIQNIKKPLSSSLHEIAKIIGSETAWKDLVTILNDFLEDYCNLNIYKAIILNNKYFYNKKS